MATDTQSLLQWLLDLLRDDHARADFMKDPDRYLNDHGYGHLGAGDFYDALCLSGDRDYKDHDHGDHHPAPHHYHKGEDGAHFLKEYITNNYTYVEDRSTHVDNSLHQRIDTDGGDFHQTVDNDTVVASGDGSVAAGGDIRDSTVTSGNHNVVGQDNNVAGDHSTTSFGQGDATNASFDGSHFGSGSGVSLSGNASGHSEANESDTTIHGGHGDTSVNTVGDNSLASQNTDQAHTDDSTHLHTEDNSHTVEHNDVNSHNPVHIDDVHI